MNVQPDKWAKGDDSSKRLVQCPACWTAAMAQKNVEWECECGELMTVVDLRATRDEKRRRVGWLDGPPQEVEIKWRKSEERMRDYGL